MWAFSKDSLFVSIFVRTVLGSLYISCKSCVVMEITVNEYTYIADASKKARPTKVCGDEVTAAISSTEAGSIVTTDMEPEVTDDDDDDEDEDEDEVQVTTSNSPIGAGSIVTTGMEQEVTDDDDDDDDDSVQVTTTNSPPGDGSIVITSMEPDQSENPPDVTQSVNPTAPKVAEINSPTVPEVDTQSGSQTSPEVVQSITETQTDVFKSKISALQRLIQMPKRSNLIAPDDRVSAKVMGTVAIVIIVLVIVSIIALDASTCFSEVRSRMLRNINSFIQQRKRLRNNSVSV